VAIAACTVVTCGPALGRPTADAASATSRVERVDGAAPNGGGSQRQSNGSAQAPSGGERASTITDYQLPPDTLKKSEALYRTALVMLVIGTAYGFAVLLLVLAARIAPRYRDLAERVSRRRLVQAVVFVPLVLVTIDALSLPVSVYGQYLQVSYGLSVQSWPSWFWDWVKGEAIGAVIGTLLVWGLYALLRRSPTRWWLYGWLGLIPILLLIILIAPVYLDPIFNTYAPLEERQPQLVAPLEQVMARGGVSIERSRMFEMQASDKVTTYNAYVTGLGASKRVVVWDNTARDLTVAETMFVFGHEKGHYVLHHLWWRLAFNVMAVLASLYFAYRAISGVLARFGARWGIRDLGDWASLPVLLLLVSVFSLVSQPIAAGVSRVLEHEADIYGLEVIHGLVPDSPQVAAHAFQKLGEKALAYPSPNPLYVFWAYDHPAVADRVRFALTYQPWDAGAPPRYVP
jgi:Zn-dependent protease with chaperone function